MMLFYIPPFFSCRYLLCRIFIGIPRGGGQSDNIFLSMVMNCKITWAKMYQITESGRNEISTRV